MNCLGCGTPAVPIELLNNYELSQALFYKTRRCSVCDAPLCDTYDDFIKEFAARISGGQDGKVQS